MQTKINLFKKIAILLFITLLAGFFGGPEIMAQSAVAPNSGPASDTSANWAGYVSAKTGSIYTTVSGTWKIPTPSVSQNTVDTLMPAADATWVGIGGVSGKDLIQAGTQAIVQNGQIEYQAWVETLPNFQETIPVAVNGGDSVTVSLAKQSANNWLLYFSDNTTGKSYSQTITYDSSLSSAEWIEEMPVNISGHGRMSFLPLDNFGVTQFTSGSTTIDGKVETISGSGAKPLTMIDGEGLLAAPSGILADGSFSINRSDLALADTPSAVAQPIPIRIRYRNGRGRNSGWSYYTFGGFGGITFLFSN